MKELMQARSSLIGMMAQSSKTEDELAFSFVDEPDKVNREHDTWVASIPAYVVDRQGLFNVLARELRFPEYFGKNWDALSDLLRDFHWLHQRRIVIVHHDLPLSQERERKTYLEILDESVKGWKSKEKHELIVVFPSAFFSLIQGIL